MREPQVRTSVATRITYVDRQTLNESISRKFYNCAPSQMRGTSRVFNSHDLLTLFVFGDLLRKGLKPATAGELACEIGGRARATPKAKRMYWITAIRGTLHVLTDMEYDPDHKAKGRQYPAIGPIFSVVEFDITAIRDHLLQEIEAERNILGADDDAE